MSIQSWEHFFKPEVRNSGRSLVTQGKVIPTRLSDTEIQNYVRASTAVKVTLQSPTVDSVSVFADCNCPLSKKGQFCKHIWAALLVAEQKYADFFDGKDELQKKPAVLIEPMKKTSLTQSRSDAQDAYKQKQADYRKEQYQKQKQRVKDKKKTHKSGVSEIEYPAQIEMALKYFSENGFDLKASMTMDNIGHAKKKLSRVFHPDVGGTHEEIQELNKFAELLTKYSKS